ncbi:alpha/beta fold hydrolase [Microbacterium sp. SORGH_AS_0888]|uniref:alpha/beta fold hydrolase n=1 Tax=Microbacterium sp. SORGH_AS_0888 TaxID=3041791 RepID=UPI0027861659|nr:alpha/beta hydrolase [Microbacterium sp. SORGH_AS_0888]MDQ1129208.1 pimeloyl-ACP methyl ester carboxylesterase [Microbacterium sp. SORGH_AS_0888]
MPVPLSLPTCAWGAPDASRRALLVHGLGSNGALMWRYGTALAEDGWHATAVDLRGHGTAPRALDYTLAAYAADVAATPGGPWDLVIGHSLGGAAATLAAAADPDWTRRLILIDPALHLLPVDRDAVRHSQQDSFADTSVEAVRRAHPHWHPNDVELKSAAASQASRWAVEQTSAQNPEWSVLDAVPRLGVRTHVIASDPAVHSIYAGKIDEAIAAANPAIGMSIVAGAGHSPHRDRPEETIRILREVLA